MSTVDGTRTDPFSFSPPSGERDAISFANGNAYEWAYLDTCRELGTDPRKVPDGWAYGWLEYTRRNQGSRMAIREAFRTWRDTGTLPGLEREG